MRSNPCVRYAVRMKEGNDSVIRKKTGRSILKNLYSRGIHEAKKVEFFRHTGWDSACQRSGRTVGGDFFRFSLYAYFVLAVTFDPYRKRANAGFGVSALGCACTAGDVHRLLQHIAELIFTDIADQFTLQRHADFATLLGNDDHERV